MVTFARLLAESTSHQHNIRVPPNVKFEIDDAEQPWTWAENFFDYIHLRTMVAGIRNWERLYQQAFR